MIAVLGVYAAYVFYNPYILEPPTMQEYALAIHEKVNVERTERGLTPLTWDPALATIASGWSQELAKRNFFSHTDPATGWGHEHRYSVEGYVCRGASGENIAGHSITRPISTEQLAKDVVGGWMESTEGHREILLYEDFHNAGVGVAFHDERGYYIAENFC